MSNRFFFYKISEIFKNHGYRYRTEPPRVRSIIKKNRIRNNLIKKDLEITQHTPVKTHKTQITTNLQVTSPQKLQTRKS